MSLQTEILSLADIPRYHARARPRQSAIVFEERASTYLELNAHASQIAQALIASGLQPGHRIAYLAKNSDRYLELLFGAAKAGVVLTPINWRLSKREVQYIIDDSDASLLFVSAEFSGYVADGGKVAVITLDESQGPRSYLAWRDAHAARDPMLVLPTDAPVLQLYTSGTTGSPKGAVLTHDNFIGLQRAQANLDWNQWTDRDASLVAMPLFHVAGTGWVLTGLYHGAMNVIAREFSPLLILNLIRTARISKLLLVPAALQILVRQPGVRQTDYSRLKYLLYGASPMPLELLRECMEVFGCGFVQLYGMTETAGAIVALGPEDHVGCNNRVTAAGKPLPGVEIAILDAAGGRLAPGLIGEVAIRSVMNMQGYWQQPDATARTIDADNWLRTGDAGCLDEEGYLFIKDRVKDLIISGGENIYPAEVESAIFGHPDVADVAVIGVPSERWGEEVKAIVVTKGQATTDAASILGWARERIAGFKVPKSVEFVDNLPRNASGKILRRELRAPYWKERSRPI